MADKMGDLRPADGAIFTNNGWMGGGVIWVTHSIAQEAEKHGWRIGEDGAPYGKPDLVQVSRL